jgi:hypothetical protein
MRNTYYRGDTFGAKVTELRRGSVNSVSIGRVERNPIDGSIALRLSCRVIGKPAKAFAATLFEISISCARGEIKMPQRAENSTRRSSTGRRAACPENPSESGSRDWRKCWPRERRFRVSYKARSRAQGIARRNSSSSNRLAIDSPQEQGGFEACLAPQKKTGFSRASSILRGTEGSNLLPSTGESGKNCTATQRLRAEGRMRFMAPGCTITNRKPRSLPTGRCPCRFSTSSRRLLDRLKRPRASAEQKQGRRK